jgi:hypothetical protein
MQEQGLKSEVDISNFEEKHFYTFRKSHVFDEGYNLRYDPMNLVNIHHTRWVNDRFREMEKQDLFKNIYLARPSIVLSLDHEFLTYKMFDKLTTYYKGSASTPK